MRGALSQFMDENYNFHRPNSPTQPTTNPTKTDLIEQIVAKKEPEMQLAYLVQKVVELNQEDADFVVEMHRQQQRGETFTDDQKQQLAAMTKQTA